MYLPRLVLILVGSLAIAQADVKLPAIFSDHAVLQKSAKVPVWGTAAPAEKVAITLGTAKAEATAGADGKWKTNLNLSESDEGPFELIVEGNNKLTVADVVVGEVWVCAGQSNMELPMGSLKRTPEEAPKSANPLLRQFTIAKATAEKPLNDVNGSWSIAAPETLKNFTAVGYYFGKDLQKELQQPVGLILTAWGGTQIEPWIPQDAAAGDADLKLGSETITTRLLEWPQRFADYLKGLEEWETKFARKDDGAAEVKLPEAGEWKPLTAENTPKEPGLIWYRQEIPISKELTEKPIQIAFRNLQGEDQVFWNGQKIGETAMKTAVIRSDRRYTIPAKLITEGTATLLVRIFNSQAVPAIPSEAALGKTILPTQWDWFAERTFPADAEANRFAPINPGQSPSPSGTTSFIYNAMVAPIIPYGIRGVIWYQGESNASRAQQYRTIFPLLIKGWRQAWGEGDFPFYFCQLANFLGKEGQPAESDWAELREAQTLTTRLPHTGAASLIELGDAGNIHPQQKAEAGQRLALLALNRTYQKARPDSGPVFKSAQIEGDKIRLTFTATDGGLVAQTMSATYSVNSAENLTAPLVRNRPQSELEGFAICGADQKWVWADAKIDGDSVIVSAPGVSQPTAVRYGWANNPSVNLYNGAGLPAGPFRTDDFPMKTRDRKYALPSKPTN